MNWSRQSSRKRRLLIAASLVVVLIAAVDIFSTGALRGFVRANSAGLITNTHEAVRSIWESGVFKTRNALARENAALKRELEEMRAVQIRYQITRAENRALRTLLEVAETRTAGITARVVSRPPASAFGTFLVGAGEASGIASDDYVLGAGGIVLGRVVEVDADTALVETLMHAGVQSQVRVADTAAEMVGRSSGNGVILLPREIKISEGDNVLLEENGLPVGIVGSIEKSPADAQQEIRVHVPLNLSAVQFVYVIPARHL